VDNKNKLVGIFTKNHLMKAVMNNWRNDITIRKVMTKDVITISENKSLDEAWEIKVGRLPVVNQEGELVGILTRTDLVEAFYKESQKVAGELKTILNSSHNGIIAINLSGKITIFNSAAEKLLNHKAEEVIGQAIENILPNTGLLSVLETKESDFGEKMTINNNIILTNRSPIFKEGKLKGSMAIFQDISELEEVSEELNTVKNLNKELDAIIESVSDGLYITNGNADTIRINDAYEEITGIKSEEVLGRNMKRLVNEGIFSESVTFQVLEERKPMLLQQNWE
jgi:PAS domain S-box-containing protein